MGLPLFDTLPPIAPSPTPLARHASSMGALHARAIAGVQMGRLFAAYAEYGPLTDLEAEDRTGIQRSSVIPRRRALMQHGLVQANGSKKERTGVTNTIWGLIGETKGEADAEGESASIPVLPEGLAE